MLAHVVERARAIPGTDGCLVATSTARADDAIGRWCHRHRVRCLRGSEADVLDRFRQVLDADPAVALVRITADCPLLDPEVSGLVVTAWRLGVAAYASNVHPRTFPDGLDTEVIAREALLGSWRAATSPEDREHVTPFLWRRPARFPAAAVCSPVNLARLRWTVDTAGDLDRVRRVLGALPRPMPFGLRATLCAWHRLGL